MTGKIIGIRYVDYADKKEEGKRIKGVEIFYVVGSMEVFGEMGKDEFIREDTPTYKKYASLFEDCDGVIGRQLEIEHEVNQYGQKAVKKLCKFEIGELMEDVA